MPKRVLVRKRKKAKPGDLAKPSKLQVRRMIKTSIGRKLEEKSYLVDASKSTVETYSSNSVMTDVFDPVQGTSDQTRIGDKVRLKRIEMTYVLTANASATDDHFVRVILFQWKLDSAARDPDDVDILQSIATYATGYRVPSALINYDYRNNFNILYDRMHLVQAGTNTYNAAFTPRIVKVFGKKLHKEVSFKGATTDGVGKIYVLQISDITSVAESPQSSCQIRTVYADG